MPVRLVPLTETFWADEGVPAVVVNPDKVAEIETEGAAAPTVPEIGLVSLLLPTLTDTSPPKSPWVAFAAIRTLTVAFTPPLVGTMVPEVA